MCMFAKKLTNIYKILTLMKVHSRQSGVSKNLLQKNQNSQFTTVRNNSFMMCMCW